MKLRKNQKELVKKVLANDSKFQLVSAPVGSGKSYIAMALLESYGRGNIITPEVSLQDQYMGEFPLHDLRGRGHYSCDAHGTCDVPSCKKAGESEEHTSKSEYLSSRKSWVEEDMSVSGFEIYYYLSTHFPLDPRVLIVDEAHKLIDKAMQMGSFSLSVPSGNLLSSCNGYLDINLAGQRTIFSKLKTHFKSTEVSMGHYEEGGAVECGCSKCMRIHRTLLNFQRAEDNPNDYVIDVDTFFKGPLSTVTVSCIKYDWVFDDLFSGVDKVILMSGTWGEGTVKSDPKTLLSFFNITDYKFHVMNSNFPAENIAFVHPLNAQPLGSDRKGLKRLDAISSACTIMDKTFSKKNGIVFCTSKKDIENFEGPRFLYDCDDKKEKNRRRSEAEQSDNKVFVTYNSRTGLNLGGFDFAVIIKFPKPAWSKLWSALNYRYTGLYNIKARIDLEQSLGRLIRSDKDTAVFLVMDAEIHEQGYNYMASNFSDAKVYNCP